MDTYYGQQYGHAFPNSGRAGQGAPQANVYGDQQYSQDYEEMSKSRRQSYIQPNTPTSANSMSMDTNGMAGFNGTGGGGQFDNFQFDPSSNGQSMMMGGGNMFPGSMGPQMPSQQPSQLSLMTQYSNAGGPISAVSSPMTMYQSPMDPSGEMGMSIQTQMMQQGVNMGLDSADHGFGGDMNADTSPESHIGRDSLDPSMMANTGNGNFTAPAPGSAFGSGNSGGMYDTGQSSPMPPQSASMDGRRGSAIDAMQMSDYQRSRRQSMSIQPRGSSMQQESPFSPAGDQSADQQNYSMGMTNDDMAAWEQQTGQFQNSISVRPGPQPHVDMRSAYSSSGFDMMTVLMRVATRKNPTINIGAVDLSCAFVVCDVLQHDIPIVYCSENFERLTGYTKHEILGRNCRFLQGPDGKVQAGVKRSYVDDDSVLYLKNMITARKEAQVSLINYRKGGQPFMNLLTMIPIAYDTPDEIRYYVGFQVDLVEQPNSVTNKNPDGTYTINYQRGLTMPRYVFSNTDSGGQILESGQTVTRDDVSTVLSTIGTGDSDLSKRLWDKVLLENTDDVILVLSLKGLFLYLSPSSKKILEYEPNELTGTALSSVCHPSDIVPVTRELKDTSTSASVNVVFRIRRKVNGFMWFEGHGALHTEQGKGRKSIVLVGRERPVYTLSRSLIASAGGIGDNEVWTKLSTSGMFLFVSSNIRSLLDRQPDELIGTSMGSLMRQETRAEFMRILEVARAGKRASTKHELINKRGQVLQAFSTVYAGDANEGEKPTFFIAQTRLMKYTRPSSGGSRPTALSKLERAGSSTSMPGASAGTDPGLSRRNSNSTTLPSPQRFMTTFEAATTFAGQHGLELGHQDIALASEENLFDELKTTRSTSWQFELRQMAKRNRFLAEELQGLLAARKKRKRRKGAGQMEKDCANCHTRVTPEWRRGPSGNRDLCNSCGLRWAKQQGRISPRTNSQRSQHSASSDKASGSPVGTKPQNMSNNDHQTSIDETLAETNTSIEAQSQSQENQAADASHVSKMVKMEAQATSPNRRYSTGVPTKIEEREDEDVMVE